MTNCYIYSHHNFGIGQFQRAAVLADAFSKSQGIDVTLLSSGSPPPSEFMPHGAKFVQLPAEFKSTPQSTTTTEPGTSHADTYAKRREIILAEFSRAAPDIFITGLFPFAPFSLSETLLPVLKHIRANYPACLVVCSARDIPILTREDVSKYDFMPAAELLSTHYDLLCVHADKSLSEFRAGGLLENFSTKVPISYTGYVVDMRATKQSSAGNGKILITVGGGRDGGDVIRAAIAALELVQQKMPLDVLVNTGPFSTPSSFEEQTSYSVKKTIPHLSQTIAQSDLVICMAGYNTTAEVFASGLPAILIPRKNSYEQVTRARLVCEAAKNIRARDTSTTARDLASDIEQLLAVGRVARTQSFDGADATVTAVCEQYEHRTASGGRA